MDTSVFFVVEPLATTWHFRIFSLLIAIFCGIIFYIFLQKKGSPKKIIQHNNPTETITNKNFSLPKIDDANFVEHIFSSLQKYISLKYLPKNTFAHTYSDIAKYCNNENILFEYQKLEKIIFDNTQITANEKQQILDTVTKIIKI